MEKEKVGSNDASQGRTIFIRNLNFDTTEEELTEFFEDYGELEYAKIVRDRVTERSRGTAFIKFVEKSDADDVLLKADADPDEFELGDRVLNICLALVKSDVPKPVYSKENDDRKRAKRNLHLARVGMITPGSKEAENMSKVDLQKRARVDKTRIEKLKDPNTFVSPLRLCVRNIPVSVDDKQLKKIFIKAGGVDCRVVECRIMRDLNRVNAQGVAKSRGFGFLAFDEHSHALKALLSVNHNPSVFGNDRRPIVEFAIESRSALEKKARRLEMSRKRSADVPETTEKPEGAAEAPKRRKKADLISAQLQTAAPNKLGLPGGLAGLAGLEKKKKKRRKQRKGRTVAQEGTKRPAGKRSRSQARAEKRLRQQ